MSVPKHERGENPYLVYSNAEKIYEKAIKVCAKLPKRYQYLIASKFVERAEEVAAYVHKANAIYLTKDTFYEEYIERRMLFQKAKGSLEDLSFKVNLLIDVPTCLRSYNKESGKTTGVTINEIEEISSLITIESNLIKGALKSDRIRFKSWHPDFE